VKPLFVLAVRVDPALERLEIGEEISVGEDHAARFAGGARGEENLRDVVSRDRFVGIRFVHLLVRRSSLADEDPMLRGDTGQIFQSEPRDGSTDRVERLEGRRHPAHLLVGRHNRPCRCFMCNAGRELGCCAVVHGHGYGAEQQAGPESHHPFSTVGAPEEDAVTGADALLAQLDGTSERDGTQLLVGPGFAAVAAALDDGDVVCVAGEISEERIEVASRHVAS